MDGARAMGEASSRGAGAAMMAGRKRRRVVRGSIVGDNRMAMAMGRRERGRMKKVGFILLFEAMNRSSIHGSQDRPHFAYPATAKYPIFNCSFICHIEGAMQSKNIQSYLPQTQAKGGV